MLAATRTWGPCRRGRAARACQAPCCATLACGCRTPTFAPGAPLRALAELVSRQLEGHLQLCAHLRAFEQAAAAAGAGRARANAALAAGALACCDAASGWRVVHATPGFCDLAGVRPPRAATCICVCTTCALSSFSAGAASRPGHYAGRAPRPRAAARCSGRARARVPCAWKLMQPRLLLPSPLIFAAPFPPPPPRPHPLRGRGPPAVGTFHIRGRRRRRQRGGGRGGGGAGVPRERCVCGGRTWSVA